MSRVIFSQIFVGNGKTNYLGLYDEEGLPVQIEVEVNDDGVVMSVVHDEVLCKDDDCEEDE